MLWAGVSVCVCVCVCVCTCVRMYVYCLGMCLHIVSFHATHLVSYALYYTAVVPLVIASISIAAGHPDYLIAAEDEIFGYA